MYMKASLFRTAVPNLVVSGGGEPSQVSSMRTCAAQLVRTADQHTCACAHLVVNRPQPDSRPQSGGCGTLI